MDRTQEDRHSYKGLFICDATGVLAATSFIRKAVMPVAKDTYQLIKVVSLFSKVATVTVGESSICYSSVSNIRLFLTNRYCKQPRLLPFSILVWKSAFCLILQPIALLRKHVRNQRCYNVQSSSAVNIRQSQISLLQTPFKVLVISCDLQYISHTRALNLIFNRFF